MFKSTNIKANPYFSTFYKRGCLERDLFAHDPTDKTVRRVIYNVQSVLALIVFSKSLYCFQFFLRRANHALHVSFQQQTKLTGQVMNMWKLEWKSSGVSTDDESISLARLGKFSGRIVKLLWSGLAR